MRRVDLAEESGRITLMAIGMVVAVLLIGYAVVAASFVHLERKSLQSIAESAAVRAASAVNVEGYVARGPGAPYLGADSAQLAIDEYVRRLGQSAPEGLVVTNVDVGGGDVRVTIEARATPPFLPDRLFSVDLKAHASAEFFGPPAP
ncbi:pilus assembly protein TadG-related protein [Bowdeniella massiliensis]|uniref:pilus assembly protein TadG-related protein n=1 Tax=Bowdeniella massiliensis TaxID=2932264 RepID=UPI002028E7DB